MAIRNDNLGGTDWTTSEVPLKAVDLNDTFDAAVAVLQQTPAFWMTSTLYDVYDNFDSSSTISSTLWSTNITGSSSIDIATSSNVANGGSSGNELKISAVTDSNLSDDYAEAISNLILPNRHTHARLYHGYTTIPANVRDSYMQVSYDGGSTYYTISYFPLDNNGVYPAGAISDFTAVAKGSDVYDLYAGGKLLAADINIASPQLAIKALAEDNSAANNSSLVYVDDVVQSKVDVS